MKIPETTANIGAYYGNEENGQWQANGVIVDVGVGGGAVGSGDAGAFYPPHARQPPHAHPGYMMAGYYAVGAYGAPAGAPASDDFSDYMWMENEDEFDKQVMQQLEEEALMEQCIEAMLEDEQRERGGRHRTRHNGQGSSATSSTSLEERLARSTLNPLAAEFVPTFTTAQPSVTPAATANDTDESDKPAIVSATEEVSPKPVCDVTTEPTTCPEEPPPAPPAPPASSPPLESQEKRARDKRDRKHNSDSRKSRATVLAVTANSDTKITTEESEKAEIIVPLIENKSPSTEEIPSGPKPINYAAAAKANKPKKATSPPVVEKPTAPSKPVEKAEKPSKPTEKSLAKEKSRSTDKPRKNSTK